MLIVIGIAIGLALGASLAFLSLYALTGSRLAAARRTRQLLISEARREAEALAERGRGDAAIRFELERQGVSAELIDEAVASLAPERDRAERIVSRRGPGPKTARLLAQRGFDPELVALAAEAPIAPEP